MTSVSDPQVLAVALASGCFLIGASGFFLIGSILTLQSLSAIMYGYVSRHWPQTTAIVVKSRVAEMVDVDGQLAFLPLVQYQYTIEGQEYESLNVCFSTNPLVSQRRAQAIITQYPATASIRV